MEVYDEEEENPVAAVIRERMSAQPDYQSLVRDRNQRVDTINMGEALTGLASSFAPEPPKVDFSSMREAAGNPVKDYIADRVESRNAAEEGRATRKMGIAEQDRDRLLDPTQASSARMLAKQRLKMTGADPSIVSDDATLRDLTDIEKGISGYEDAYTRRENAKALTNFRQSQGGRGNDTRAETATAKYRQEVTGSPTYKAYVESNNAHDQMSRALSGDGTAYGDIAAIFTFMKAVDPVSTVREGEFATAQNAAGVPTKILNAYNQSKQGTRLDSTQRGEMLEVAKQLVGARKSSHDAAVKPVLAQARRRGYRTEEIDPFAGSEPASEPTKQRSVRMRVSNGKETLEISADDLVEAERDGFKVIR